MPDLVRKYYVLGIGALSIALYWLFDVYFLHNTSIYKEILDPSQHENMMRLGALIFILLFSLVTQYFVSTKARTERKAQNALKELDQVFRTAANGMRIVDTDFNIVRSNETLLRMLHLKEEEVVGKKCHEVFWGPACHTQKCPLTRISHGEIKIVEETVKASSRCAEMTCIVTATPFVSLDGRLIGIVEDFHDITARKKAEQERKNLIKELQIALDEVKTLNGLLPICAYCKKIRDDKGYWNQIEAYIAKNSEAKFTHSICEECMNKHYPQYTANKGTS